MSSSRQGGMWPDCRNAAYASMCGAGRYLQRDQLGVELSHPGTDSRLVEGCAETGSE